MVGEDRNRPSPSTHKPPARGLRATEIVVRGGPGTQPPARGLRPLLLLDQRVIMKGNDNAKS